MLLTQGHCEQESSNFKSEEEIWLAAHAEPVAVVFHLGHADLVLHIGLWHAFADLLAVRYGWQDPTQVRAAMVLVDPQDEYGAGDGAWHREHRYEERASVRCEPYFG